MNSARSARPSYRRAGRQRSPPVQVDGMLPPGEECAAGAVVPSQSKRGAMRSGLVRPARVPSGYRTRATTGIYGKPTPRRRGNQAQDSRTPNSQPPTPNLQLPTRIGGPRNWSLGGSCWLFGRLRVSPSTGSGLRNSQLPTSNFQQPTSNENSGGPGSWGSCWPSVRSESQPYRQSNLSSGAAQLEWTFGGEALSGQCVRSACGPRAASRGAACGSSESGATAAR